jgi:hypothetical protein
MKLTVCCVLVAFMSVMLVSVQANSIAVRSIGKFQLNNSNFHRLKCKFFVILRGPCGSGYGGDDNDNS